MMGALQAASLFGVIDLQDNFSGGVQSAKNSLDGLASHLSSTGGKISSFGATLTGITAPITAGFALATNSAMAFDSELKNIQAILQITTDEADTLGDQIASIGSRSRFGASGAVAAFTEIAGGVEDASTHMAILESAISAAQAGQADLGETTSAMVGIMNSYKFSAEDAVFVTDVLTQTVGMGVGSMGEFGTGLASITGLANSLNIPLDELGGAMAYLTTTGNSASQAGTQLSAMMVAMLNPNEKMKKALEEAGVASGQAAIEQYGLVGAYQLLGRESETFQSQMAGTLGSTEALRGATALLADEAAGFVETFSDSLDGLTASAEDIQMQSAAAQFDLLKAQIEGLGLSVGSALLPSFQKMVTAVTPIIASVTKWISENPKLVATVGMIAGAVAALGAVMVPVGMVISGAGAAIGVLGGALAFLLSPVGLVVAGVAALGAAFATNFMGIRDFVQPVLDQIGEGLDTVKQAIGWFIEDVQNFGLIDAIMGAFGMGESGAAADDQSWLEGILTSFGMARDTAEGFVNGIGAAFGGFIAFIQEKVIPGLNMLADWFMGSVLPAVVDFVSSTIIPGVQNFINLLAGLWSVISPSLNTLFDWFTGTGLPLIWQAIDDIINQWITPFIDLLAAIWERVQPALQSLFDWFTGTGLPLIGEGLDYALSTYVLPFIEELAGIWTSISEGVGNVLRWFTETGLPIIDQALESAKTDYIEPFINILVGIWAAVQPGLDAFKSGIDAAFTWIKDNVIAPFTSLIDGIGATINDLLSSLGLVESRTQNASDYLNTDGTAKDKADAFLFGGVQGRATGGDVFAGTPYVVGEAGPELFIPSASGSIVPNHALGGGSGRTLNFSAGAITIRANSEAEGRAAARAFGAELEMLINEAG